MNKVPAVLIMILLIPALAGNHFAQSESPDSPSAGVGQPQAAIDSHALNRTVGGELIAENVRTICRESATLSPADRFEFLCRWTLPGSEHPDFRVAGAFTQTDPSPLALEQDPVIQRSPRGALLVSPVFKLLDAAAETGQLVELRERIARTAEPDDEFQRRARTALRVLVHLELGETEDADNALADLHALAAQTQPVNLHEQWPETLVVYRGLNRFPDVSGVGDLLSLLYSQRTLRRSSANFDEWHTQIVSLLGRYRQQRGEWSDEEFNTDMDLDDWISVVKATARSRGQGTAHARWILSDANEVHHVSGHQEEYLFYRAPLRGNFTVECDVRYGGATQVLAAGGFFGTRGRPDQLESGTFRDGTRIRTIVPPFSMMRNWVRYRAVFQDNAVTVFLNGRRVHEELLPAHYDPWIGIRSWWRNAAQFRDFRITGQPEIPDSVVMSASRQLVGWIPYYGESAGSDGARWQWRADADSTGQIVGSRTAGITGSFSESLLRYHRPLDENGSVEYEFFHESGEVHSHPAIDRLAFMLHDDGVRVHWMTDAPYDQTEVSPDNLIDERQHQRGPSPLPLINGAWNHLELSLQGNVVQVALNGERVFERPIEPANRRTFGLFHYADQTEVRVRNVVMRGDWADINPTGADQQLADTRVAELDAGRDRLPAVVTHDFGEGTPGDFFRRGRGDTETHVTSTDAGIRVNESSAGPWACVPLYSQFSLEGDFDIEASFDQFDTGDPEGYSSIHMLIKVKGAPNSPRLQFRAERASNPRWGEHLKGQLVIDYPDGTRRHDDAMLWDESTSGRLRIARRGDKVTMLFAQGDSPLFRIIGEHTVADGGAPIEGMQLNVVADKGGRCSVVWKDFTLFADQIIE